MDLIERDYTTTLLLFIILIIGRLIMVAKDGNAMIMLLA